MEHPSNSQIAQALDELAEHLEFEGSRYPARAYRGAARTVRQLPMSVGALAMAGRATDLRGIGTSISGRIVELCETGAIAELERLRERTPTALMVLTHLPGISQRIAQAIWDALTPRSLDDLMEAVDDGRLLTVRGVGPATVDAVRLGLLTLEEAPEEAAVQLLRSHAQRAAADVRGVLEQSVPGVLRIHVAGQLARGWELIDVLDLVVVAADAPAATAALRDQLDHRGWLTASEDAVGDACVTFALHGSSGAGVRIHVASERSEATALLHGIGPNQHAREVSRRAAARAGAPRVVDAARPADPAAPGDGAPADAAMYAAAGLAWVPPELRDRSDVLERAAAAPLPRLVDVADLAGELHCHSDWSDGRATLAQMAEGALRRGYQYMAITDHSVSLRITNGLSHGDLAAQWRELEHVRATLPSGFELLQGTEMEILPDGSLDYADDILRRLDWVVASLHTNQRQEPAEITRRIERALRNPFVDCIGHPTSRLLLRRPKTGLDTDRLIELAAQTGTFLEINASPDRLDLDAPTAERAAAAGVLLCIDSDAHGPETLSLVEHGVAIARHAGLRADQVVNTRSWPEIRDLQKRWRA